MTTSRRLWQAPLSSAAAWIPSPGPWRRSGHSRGTNAASPGQPGGSAATSAGSGVSSGLQGTRWPGSGAGGGEEALAGFGESSGGAPGGCAPTPGVAVILAPRSQDPPTPRGGPTGARQGEWQRLQEISNLRLNCTQRAVEPGAGAPELMGGARPQTSQRNARKIQELCLKQLLAFSLPVALVGRLLGIGEREQRGVLGRSER